MKNQFIQYEMSVKLKELGFNEKCFDVYSDVKSVGMFRNSPRDRTPKILWQQAFDFLLNKTTDEYSLEQSNDIFFISYEGLDILRKIIVNGDRKLCLEKLIEIVENKKG